MDLFSYWHEFYNDPWFWQFPMATLAISMAAFLTVAIPWTLVTWIDPVALRKYNVLLDAPLHARKQVVTEKYPQRTPSHS